MLAIVSWGASGCGNSKKSAPITPELAQAEPSERPVSQAQRAELVQVDPQLARGSQVPTQLLRLNKDFWLGRDIWISVGVERASVTGLAMSLVGYVPAQIRRSPHSLMIEQKNTGLFGGSVLGPELLLNAYPIVAENDSSILVDFASPLNPYGLSNAIGAPDEEGNQLIPSLEILRSIDVKEDSLSFHSVLTGTSKAPFFARGDESSEDMANLNPHQVSLSLRVDWLLEASTPDFRPLKAGGGIFGFFLDQDLVVDSGLRSESFVNRINHRRPMIWEMSANTPQAFRKAVSDGVTLWNQAFENKEVLQVRLADGTKTFTDPSSSNVIWDDNQAVGMAFANWRSNPYTGEILQAQVYMSGAMWAESGRLVYKIRDLERRIRNGEAIPLSTPEGLPALKNDLKKLERSLLAIEKQQTEQKRAFVGLSPGMASQAAKRGNFCQRETPIQQLRQELAQLRGIIFSTTTPTAPIFTASVTPPASNPAPPRPTSPMPPAGQSEEAFMADVVRSVVMHEVGHAIGLRHNFMGSIGTSGNGKIQSASIMDYNDLVIDAQFDRPGDADIAVIKTGYFDDGVVSRSIPFCTDEDLHRDRTPDCFAHDFGSDPVESALTAQESQLLLGMHHLMNGDARLGVNFILRASRSVHNLAAYVVYSTELGLMRGFMRGDFGFVQKQQKAWDNFVKASQMQGMEFPAPLKNAFRQLTLQVLFSRVQPSLSSSALEDKVLEKMKEALSDAEGQNQAATRSGALAALIRAQSTQARSQLVDLSQELEARLARDEELKNMPKEPPVSPILPTLGAGWMSGVPLVFTESLVAPPPPAPPAPAERSLEARMLDQEFLARIQQVLNGNYFR